mmetsp:Transcript_33572/g.72752  ORF Transcript_33572/g.72752 Transcript_33572/m.72752 type:complete len:259 (+) Transcript_33572:869-1645(+)
MLMRSLSESDRSEPPASTAAGALDFVGPSREAGSAGAAAPSPEPERLVARGGAMSRVGPEKAGFSPGISVPERGWGLALGLSMPSEGMLRRSPESDPSLPPLSSLPFSECCLPTGAPPAPLLLLPLLLPHPLSLRPVLLLSGPLPLQTRLPPPLLLPPPMLNSRKSPPSPPPVGPISPPPLALPCDRRAVSTSPVAAAAPAAGEACSVEVAAGLVSSAEVADSSFSCSRGFETASLSLRLRLRLLLLPLRLRGRWLPV